MIEENSENLSRHADTHSQMTPAVNEQRPEEIHQRKKMKYQKHPIVLKCQNYCSLRGKELSTWKYDWGGEY